MIKFVQFMRNLLLKIKNKILSVNDSFLQTKAGKIIAAVASVLGKFFQTKKGRISLILISFASYLIFVTWQFSVMVIAMLYVHELGHILAMKYYGMKTNGMYFIPFVGAAVPTETNYPSQKAGVMIAMAGPLFGFILALVFGGIYFATQNPLYAVMANFTAIFNWFNLLPVYPLDGGRVAKSVFSSFHWRLEIIFMVLSGICLLSLGIFSLYQKYFLTALFFIVFGLVVMVVSLFWEKETLPPLKGWQIFGTIIFYLAALAAMLVFAVWIIDVPQNVEIVKIIRTF